MKKIEAILKPFKLDDVKERLAEMGVQGLTVSEVRGHGRQGGHSERYRGAGYVIDFVPKVKLELVVSDERVAPIIALIEETARTGKIGDGKIFVTDIDDAIRIRTGQHGRGAVE